MAALFGDIPGALSNSVRIAEMCDVRLDDQATIYPSSKYQMVSNHIPICATFAKKAWLNVMGKVGLLLTIALAASSGS